MWEGVGGDRGVGGILRFEGAVSENRYELVDGTGAGEGAGMAVEGEVVADAGEGFVEVERVQWFVFFMQV